MAYFDRTLLQAVWVWILKRKPGACVKTCVKTCVTLHNEDCVEGMKNQVATSFVDTCVTSPPYNIGVKYNTYNDSQKRLEYLEWCKTWTDEVYRVLKPDGSFFLNLGACPRDPFLPYELVLQLRNRWKLQNTFHWVKSITIDGPPLVSKGHFKPINSNRFVNECHEFVFHLTKTGSVRLNRLAVGVPYADQSNIKRWKHTTGKNLRCRGNVWFIPYKTIQSRDSQRPHPATFPVDLVAKCLALHGSNKSTTVVLDPFFGTGTSALAAIDYGANEFIGYEIDPCYAQYAQQQVNKQIQ